MFCPKCGIQNPDNGKFCRSCGTDLGTVTEALSGKLPETSRNLTDSKNKPMTWEKALKPLALGVAFIVISFILGVSGAGRGWWFWLLIPGFMTLASGIAGIIQLQRMEKAGGGAVSDDRSYLGKADNPALPSPQTEWVAPETSYKTGDLVPPSVTDGTTRLLERDSEGETRALPKK